MISMRFRRLKENSRDEAQAENWHYRIKAQAIIRENEILNLNSFLGKCAISIYKRMMMEKCYSSLSIPQVVIRPAKRSLVKTARSDGETNFKDQHIFEDYFVQPKKLRLNKFTYSFEDFGENYMLSPPTGENEKKKPTDFSSQDDLWTSIEPSYKALMARDLIEECNETKDEIRNFAVPAINSCSNASLPPILSVAEFKQKFNQLHDKLHFIHIAPNDELIEVCQIKDLSDELHMLKEQTEVLKLMNPELSEDIAKWTNILSNKWDLVEKILYPQKAVEQDKAFKDLGTQMKDIRGWLREVEDKLRKLHVNPDSSLDEISDVLNQQKILQQEIEGRGKELTSLVRQCDSLEGATIDDSKRLRRAATHLERSWHNIWIRSLEKQCLTEQRLLQHQNNDSKSLESSDIDSDEGPLNKHRRLSLDRWTAVKTLKVMDKTSRIGSNKCCHDILQRSPTKDIGILCSDLVPVNDKCIMVGTTGIAALKAEYGDDFTNFEIIQDVGYSSESSTHLSSDDSIGIGGDRYFKIRVYKYFDDKPVKTSLSLKEELENACAKQFCQLSSSVDSSSGGTSLNDSGLCTTEPTGEGSEGSKEPSSYEEKLNLDEDFSSGDACLASEESDYLETIFESCPNFDIGKKDEDIFDGLNAMPFSLSGIDSDDASCDFHDRMSFTKPAQVFYKMISVDSDNDTKETDLNNASTKKLSSNQTTDNIQHNQPSHNHHHSDHENNFVFNPHINPTFDFNHTLPKTRKNRTSTPLNKSYYSSYDETNHQTLKRKRTSDSTSSNSAWEFPSDHVQSWLNRCSQDIEEPHRNIPKKSLFRFGCKNDSASHYRCTKSYDDFSSCDASGEYTSSSADEGNVLSSSPLDDSSFFAQEGRDSFNIDGSLETVVRNLSTSIRTDSDTVEFDSCVSVSRFDSSLTHRDSESRNKTISYFSKDFRSSTVSCDELRLGATKTSSEGDLRACYSSGKENVDNCRMKAPRKDKYHYKQRLSKSLPDVLKQQSGSSTEDANAYLQRDLHQTQKSCSSASEIGKRKKRRKKSSSSARSSRSVLNDSDNGRQRLKTVTNSLIGYGSRSRHFSQQSIFLESSENNFYSEDDGSHSEVKISRGDDLVRKNINEDLVLDDSYNECLNSEILSPVESDVVLTNLEEQSTVSDQVWDSYQEMPYLSEGYSEATVDEEALRKLTEFGDDYGSAIGQPLRFMNSSNNKTSKSDAPRSPKKSSKSSLIGHGQRLNTFSNESDSDSEDLHNVIEETKKALHLTRATFKKGQSGDFFTSTDYADLLATCGAHLRCLHTISDHIENGIKFSNSDLKEFYHLIEEWTVLQKNVGMLMSGSEDYVKEKYMRVQKKMDDLFQTMEELESFSNFEVDHFITWNEIKEKISQLQTLMTTLQSTKEKLLAVNLEVHRFMTDHGGDLDYKDCSLKEHVTELYQRWDDIYENNQKQLTSLEILSTQWKICNDKLRAIRYNVKFVEELTQDCCDKNSKTNGRVDLKCLTKSLEDVQKEAAQLKVFMKGGPLWKTLDQELQGLAERISKHTRRGTSVLDLEDDPDDQFEDAMQLLESNNCDSSRQIIPRGKTGAKEAFDSPIRKKPSRFWRMMKVAVPVQFALVFLYCLACCLEPSCCDMLNNFNFSLSSHLRYWRGPPPV